MDTMKICTGCGKELPPSTEYFYIDRRYKDGLMPQCKECKKEYGDQYRQEHAEEIKEYQRSDKGKAARNRANKKYKQTPQGKAAQKKYHQSLRGKATRKKYEQLDKRKAINSKVKKEYYRTINGYLRCVYGGIKRRCSVPKCKDFERYGSRGIKCLFTSDEFVDYVVNDMKVDPRGLQIHRIENDGHYEPGNIQFLTPEQHREEHRQMEPEKWLLELTVA